MTDHEQARPPPDGGWRPIDDGDFERLTGPMFWSTRHASAEEPVRVGFRVIQKHLNAGQFCHGGMMATFIDMALGLTKREALKLDGPTMSLTIDFLNGAAPGDWIESRSRFVHATYKTAYCDVIALGPKGPVARANGIFRIIRPKGTT